MNRIKRHIKSYSYSVNGIWLAFRYEHNMLFHLAGAIAVVITNTLLNVTKTDWLITLILIGVVWMAELFNTAIEKLADRVTKDQDPLIGQVKDIASGAVLIVCCFAAVCAAIIYWPYLVG
ncbi:diacylglycerol kinase family protein [Mucilaginibacter sp. 14171R-50]|uniref:diacylglycerol kinase n=1 Tax=Mucilaginibacter sp. 14171R-50 TaxID=2703789 RepID=UPI00138C3931|nr:diacylglycerol kinase family protein [Mucilaginibacter sp. 14171R-50]QHS56357.1 diacylglycerol kinase family protein [Mucilaginibacter sp. 14171R-50]